jgi:hypothetical protein
VLSHPCSTIWTLVSDIHFFSLPLVAINLVHLLSSRDWPCHVSKVPSSTESSMYLLESPGRPCHCRTLLPSKQRNTRRPKLGDRGSRRGFSWFLLRVAWLASPATHLLSLASVKLPRRWLAPANEALACIVLGASSPWQSPRLPPYTSGIILSIRAVIPELHLHLLDACIIANRRMH